jgi:hypothetical protein
MITVLKTTSHVICVLSHEKESKRNQSRAKHERGANNKVKPKVTQAPDLFYK